MVDALLALLFFQLVGEVVSRALSLPVPGPVLGMLLLFIFLRWRGGPPPQLSATAHGILSHLPLLFVPAGVGVMVHLGLLASEGIPLLVTIVVSTTITLLVTGLVMRFLRRK